MNLNAQADQLTTAAVRMSELTALLGDASALLDDADSRVQPLLDVAQRLSSEAAAEVCSVQRELAEQICEASTQ